MKKLIAASAVLAALSSGAMATEQNINLSATVDGFCQIGGSSTPAAKSHDFGTISLGVFSGTNVNVNVGAVTCNKAANITLASEKGALITNPAVAAVTGFQNYINYTATIAQASIGTTADASVSAASTTGVTAPATGLPRTSAGAFTTASVDVAIAASSSNLPLLAGSYADKVTVTISPTP